MQKSSKPKEGLAFHHICKLQTLSRELKLCHDWNILAELGQSKEVSTLIYGQEFIFKTDHKLHISLIQKL